MAVDFVGGCVGGILGVMVGHPLDTIKVRLQTQDFRNPQYRGTFHCFKSILQTEKVPGFFKGMSSPVVALAFVNAIVFGVYGNVQRRLPNAEQVSAHAIGGAAAGFTQSFIVSPMELAKTRMQLQGLGKTASTYRIASSATGPRPVMLYKSPIDCLSQIAKKEGWRRGVFRGLGITLAREIPGCGIYFFSYEYLTRATVRWYGTKQTNTFQMAMAGGLAGTVSWILTYPVDVIKSRLQADGVNGVQRYAGTVDCLRKSVREEGRAVLIRGIQSTILRAFPVNATCFTACTWVFRLWGTPKPNETGIAEEGIGKGVELLQHHREPEEPVGGWLPGAGELTLSQHSQAAHASSQFGLKDFLQVTKGVSAVLGMGGDVLPVTLAGTPGTVTKGDHVDTTSLEGDVSKGVLEASLVKAGVGVSTKQDTSPPARERSYSLSRGSRSGHDGLLLPHGDHGVSILAKLGSLREEKIGGHIQLEEYPSIELF